jgi:foldase protein PrsA
MTLKLTVALVALGSAAVVAGCGNDVPSGAVAKIGDATIEKSEFDKWLNTAVKGQAQGGAAAATPDPPEFEKCAQAIVSQPAPQGSQKPTEADAKKQCKDQYEQLKDEVMQFLIQAEWVEQEAENQDVKVSDAEVQRSLEDQKKQAFPKEKDYQEFLKTSGMTEEDILFRVKLDTLQTKLTQKITEDEGKVSNEEVSEYYDENKERFAQPERRDLNVVLTKTEAKADQALNQLQDGQSFKAVSKEFSIDEASKSQGGKLPDVAKGQQEKALDDAVFSAERGDLEGPVKTQFGFYVFEVSDITPASQQSLDQASETIKNLLRSQQQQEALDEWIKDFREEYKDKTDCADDYVIAECSNAPKEKTDTGPASGGAPQGAPPPTGAPPTTGAPPPTGAPPTGGAPTPAPAPTAPAQP